MIRLLIADDEKLERDALTEMVARRFDEHQVVLETAENGRKAADTAILWGADLILMDIEMPGMSGLRVCEELRKSSTVPIRFRPAKQNVSLPLESGYETSRKTRNKKRAYNDVGRQRARLLVFFRFADALRRKAVCPREL